MNIDVVMGGYLLLVRFQFLVLLTVADVNVHVNGMVVSGLYWNAIVARLLGCLGGLETCRRIWVTLCVTLFLCRRVT